MRTILWALAAALVLSLPAGFASRVDPPALDAPERYIVGFFENPGLEVGDTYQGERVVAVDLDLVFVVVETRAFALFEARASLDDNVRYVEYDDPQYAVLDFVPNDARYNDAGHWGSKKIGAETAWDRTLGTTAVKVAIIDSGLRKTHEDVTGSRVLQGYDFQNNDNDPNDESGCSYHGSHVTGTALGTINNAKGIAGMSQSLILPIKAFYSTWAGCTAGTTPLVNSLKYAGDQGAHISSNSWGGGSSTSVKDAIQYAHNKGTIHVAAAGNAGPCTNCINEPWKSKETITIIVTSTTSTDGFSSFSSEGVQSDVAAPGSSILSLSGSSNTAYQTMSGTSMATPHVAGTAALIKTLNPSFTFSQMESRIKSTAVDLGAAGEDDKFGAGRLSAAASVT